MNKRFVILIVMVLIFGFACSVTKEADPDPAPVTGEYKVKLPDGKLPWPHHRPSMTQAEYNLMMNGLFIINNYGLFQGSQSSGPVYFHDALDIVLNNGTHIYAIEAGYVNYIKHNDAGFAAIVIGDAPGTQPGYGWSYAHVNNFQFAVGDYVKQGDHIANVFFKGIEHIHLSRVYSESGVWDSYSDLMNVYPDAYFIYTDTIPPIIKTPFFYFENQTDTIITPGEPTEVKGQVDIVVGIRDGGEHAHSKSNNYGDRLSVARIEYEITGSPAGTIYRKSHDFTKLEIGGWKDNTKERVYTIFKPNWLFHGVTNIADGVNGDKVYSFYNISNCPPEGITEPGPVDISHGSLTWDTLEKDNDGNLYFPDGVYTITVTAYDFSGNSSFASDTVIVRNIPE